MKAKNITDATFPVEVLQSDKPTLVDLWAPWCGPCQFIGPIIEEVAAENEGRFHIAKLNIDENPKIASGLGVRSIPTLLFFKDGELRDQVVGTTTKKNIVGKLEALEETRAAA